MPPKPIFKTAVPFAETQWPDIPAPTQAVILDLLCNLLDPLGQHRQAHIQPSKGKKRKRPVKGDDAETVPPSPPELSNHVLVGLNSVTRHLSALTAETAPPSAPAASSQEARPEEQPAAASQGARPEERPAPLSILILPHPQPSSSLAHAHLPTLLYLSTTASSQPTILVTLPTSAEARLASTLHIPRVGALGIKEGAPGADSLIAYVREHVQPVKAKWIEEALKNEWKGVKAVAQTA